MAPTSSSKNISTSNQFPGKPNNPLRRSFSGSPFGRPPPVVCGQRGGGGTGGVHHPNTPFNSPSSGYPRRHSIGRENFVVLPRDFEDKENPKDQSFKSPKAGSPVPVTKGAKNFMSPTISASSKINSSLRRKILVDRNEPCRTSVSFSDAQGLSMEDMNLKTEKDTNRKKEVSFNSTITYFGDQESLIGDEDSDSKDQTCHNNDFNALPESSSMEKDLVNLDPSFKSPGADYRSSIPASAPPEAEPSVRSPYFAPLDADPSMPPYDPETNYLSPRPRFLHYRPNPRLEYLKKRDAKQLEESFSSESSDTEGVSEEDTNSESLQKSSEDSSSDDGLTEVEEEEREEEEEQLLDSELNHVTTTEATAERKRVSNPYFFTKSKLIALLLVLVVGWSWVSVSQSPVMSPLLLNNLNFPQIHVPPAIKELKRNNLDALALEFWTRLHHCYSYITGLFSISREQHNLEGLGYVNLTVLTEDFMSKNFAFYHSNSEAEAIREEKIDVRPLELEDHTTDIDENTEKVPEDNQEHLEEPDEVALPNNSGKELALLRPAEEVYARQHCDVAKSGKSEEKSNHEIEDAVPTVLLPGVSARRLQPLLLPQPEVSTAGKLEDLSGIISIDEAEEFNDAVSDDLQSSEFLTAGKIEDLSDIISIDEAEESSSLDAGFDDLQSSESPERSLSALTATFPPQILTGIGFFVLSLLGIAAFFCVKTKKSQRSAAAAALDQIPLLKVDKSPSLVLEENGSNERPASRTRHMDMDLVGESYPSEMSSFWNNSSHSKKGSMWSGEAQNQERSKPRKSYKRESLASSDLSTGSPSYGSFTTYEKITSKEVDGAEQVITPVRRSSRIRNLVTSP